jgi:hypothetical protein
VRFFNAFAILPQALPLPPLLLVNPANYDSLRTYLIHHCLHWPLQPFECARSYNGSCRTSEGAHSSTALGSPSKGACSHNGTCCTSEGAHSSTYPGRVPVPLPATAPSPPLPVTHFVSTDQACFVLAKQLHLSFTSSVTIPQDQPTPPTHPSQINDPSLPLAYLALAKFLQLDPHQLESLNGSPAYKAIHPGPGRNIEYPELLRSSASLLWEESCAKEACELLRSSASLLWEESCAKEACGKSPVPRKLGGLPKGTNKQKATQSTSFDTTNFLTADVPPTYAM